VPSQPLSAILDTTLANHGGPTKTLTLVPGSPAVDAVPTAQCTDVDGHPLATDQRGVTRPQGPACDIGAFALEAGFTFSGFFAPVANPPALNVLKAGSAVPVQFSLGDN
jgi:hypothetical protein